MIPKQIVWESFRNAIDLPLLKEYRTVLIANAVTGKIDVRFFPHPLTPEPTMNQKTYQLPLTFEQILNLVLQLTEQEQEKLIQEIKKTSLKNEDEDLLSVFDRIGRNAQAKGLTKEILEELLSDES